MMEQTDKYLEETLFQAKRHGLHTSYIKQLEAKRDERMEWERDLRTDYRNI